ncbi:MAG: cobalamin-dependent protein [Phycisphaeraceae bacterium]|nr:cobalamin-dependent protein [Phycisphaeraceae bacterium]
MSHSVLIERFFEALVNGDRPSARAIVQESLDKGSAPGHLLSDLFWPTYESIEKLYRSDQLSKLSHHMGTRLLRVLVDQNAARMTPKASTGRTIFALCGPRDSDELGAQMAVDMLESAGFQVRFAGGNIANDEVMAHVNEEKPDVLLMFASGANDLPNIRALIDQLREIGACPNVQIAVGGGVFNRADGLAEEIGADLWANSPMEMVDVLVSEPARRAQEEQRTVGRKRRVRREAA